MSRLPAVVDGASVCWSSNVVHCFGWSHSPLYPAIAASFVQPFHPRQRFVPALCAHALHAGAVTHNWRHACRPSGRSMTKSIQTLTPSCAQPCSTNATGEVQLPPRHASGAPWRQPTPADQQGGVVHCGFPAFRLKQQLWAPC